MDQGQNYQPIPVKLIREPSHRLRESIAPEALGELADSMAAEGLHQPIGVRGPLADGTYEVIFGHRRLLAAQLLEWATVPARLFDAGYDPLLAAVSENLQREQLTPVEEARAIQRFVERHEPDAAIARFFRRSLGWVKARRELLAMPADIQDAVQAGELRLGVAAALADIDHEAYRKSLIAEAARTGATAPMAELWRQHYLTDRQRIIGNGLVVEDILSRREAWKIMITCELCQQDRDYQDTRSVRVCSDCYGQLQAAMHDAADETRAGPAPH
jgi:ParB family chromosome partitioning protein